VTTAVVIVAAGSGTRLGSATPKAFVSLGSTTLLETVVGTLNSWTHECSIVVVAPEGWIQPAKDLTAHSVHPVTVVAGGATRTQSVRNGLAALPPGATSVLIHDAARALMPVEVFDRVVHALHEGHAGVIPILPVVDTLVKVEPETHVMGEGVDRSELGAVQTPQGFRTSELLAAYDQVSGDFTDDASVLRAAGHDVVTVEGDHRGAKITYPEDLERARTLLARGANTRVGTAIDVHRFDADSPLWLAGLEWPGEAGLKGHSDGDVVVHAIVDALLQAAGLGDLGTHFGSDRPEFAGARSGVFLSHALELLHNAGFRVVSVGVQVIATTPKIGPRRDEAERHLSFAVGAPVALSATTTDGLGLTGRGEGAAALATAVIAPV